MSKVVVSYSGGMDSYTLLRYAMHEGHEVHVLSFDYHQKHSLELIAGETVCRMLELPRMVIPLHFMDTIASNSALTSDKPVPKGHYADENMKQTVVPNRNMILTSIAIAYAVNNELDKVWLGQHAGDHAIYPDCRPEFVEAMDFVGHIANWHPVKVEAPFISIDKTGILGVGKSIGLTADDYITTWTCYDPQPDGLACGKCGSCTERLEAFDAVGWEDPIPYAEA